MATEINTCYLGPSSLGAAMQAAWAIQLKFRQLARLSRSLWAMQLRYQCCITQQCCQVFGLYQQCIHWQLPPQFNGIMCMTVWADSQSQATLLPPAPPHYVDSGLHSWASQVPLPQFPRYPPYKWSQRMRWTLMVYEMMWESNFLAWV